MVKGKCEICGKGRVPQFSVNHGKVTRLPGSHTDCDKLQRNETMIAKLIMGAFLAK